MDGSTAGFPSLRYFQECVQLMSIDSVMPSNHLILCNLLLLSPSISPSIRVFLKWISSLHQVDLCISIGSSTSVSVLPMKIQEWFSLGLTCLISLLSKGLSKVFSSTTVERNQLFGAQLFFIAQLLHLYTSTGKITALMTQTFVGKVMPLLFN